MGLHACEGRICLAQAMPSIRIDPGARQGRAKRAGCAGRRSLTGAGIGAFGRRAERKDTGRAEHDEARAGRAG